MVGRNAMRIFRILFLLVAVTILVACGATSQQSKFEPTFEAVEKSKVEVLSVKNETGAEFEFDAEQKMLDEVAKHLEEEELLWTGDGPKVGLMIRLVDYEKGNAFKRWLWPGYGSTILRVECDVIENDVIVGSVDALRTVSWGGGFSIGAWSTVFGQLGDDIVKELKKTLIPEI